MESKNNGVRRTSNNDCYWIVAVVSLVLLTASFSLAQEGNSQQITDKAAVSDRYIVRFRDYVEDHPAVAAYRVINGI